MFEGTGGAFVCPLCRASLSHDQRNCDSLPTQVNWHATQDTASLRRGETRWPAYHQGACVPIINKLATGTMHADWWPAHAAVPWTFWAVPLPREPSFCLMVTRSLRVVGAVGYPPAPTQGAPMLLDNIYHRT